MRDPRWAATSRALGHLVADHIDADAVTNVIEQVVGTRCGQVVGTIPGFR
ncbi:hypothetical protein [Nocardia arizonensis]|nr:hypothetical protein [Nocardia arizonensis]